MAELTLFSAPKGFGDAATSTSQRNAIGSWKQLSGVDVLLLGNEIGLAEAARELGARHMPNVEVNANRVPLVSSMIRLARETSDSELLCIINADIILLPDFLQTVRQLVALGGTAELRRGFVLVSRRWDLDVAAPLDFSEGWDARVSRAAHEQGRLHRPAGSDLFLFPRSCYTEVPDFAIGRAGWDNWMIYKARKEGWAVVDGTPSLTIIHQNHDYRHLPGGRPHYDHPDTAVNTQLAGGESATRYSLLDTTHVLESGRLRRPRINSARIMRAVEIAIRRVFFFLPARTIENVARPKRWNKRLKSLLRKIQG